MNEKVKKLLKLKDKGISQTNDPFARLFRTALVDMNMNDTRWADRMMRYLLDPSNRIPRNSTAQASEKGNLNKALSDDKMTIAVFLKALKFLGPEAATFGITLKWNPSRTTHHEIVMPIRSAHYPPSEKEESGE